MKKIIGKIYRFLFSHKVYSLNVRYMEKDEKLSDFIRRAKANRLYCSHKMPPGFIQWARRVNKKE
jgi:hypothetical protein